MAKILAFSDLHHTLARAEAIVAASKEADLVIGVGDFANHRQKVPEALNLLAGVRRPFVAVPGNNESHAELLEAAHDGTIVLHGEETALWGLRIFGIGGGIPVTPWDWSFDLTEEAAAALMARCDKADILITHSPPKGVVDSPRDGLSLGSVAVKEAIERIQPRLVLCGHIHECWGQDGMIGQSRICNLGPTPNWFEL